MTGFAEWRGGGRRPEKDALVYIHGKGGGAGEAGHYRALFPDCDVIGLDYRSRTPWEAAREFPRLFDSLCGGYGSVSVVANSIGAYFALHALAGRKIRELYLVSPIVDMALLIEGMMAAVGVTEKQLMEEGEIALPGGETLSWEYLCWARKHPAAWNGRVFILRGENDALQPISAIEEFAWRTGASLTVMKGGEHWFHTPEQMAFLDGWIRGCGKG